LTTATDASRAIGDIALARWEGDFDLITHLGGGEGAIVAPACRFDVQRHRNAENTQNADSRRLNANNGRRFSQYNVQITGQVNATI